MLNRSFILRSIAGSLTAAVVTLLTASTTGCDGLSFSCTLVGCDDQVTVTVSNAASAAGPLSVDVVVDGTTSSFTVDVATGQCMSGVSGATGSCNAVLADSFELAPSLPQDFEESAVDIQVVVKDKNGMTLLDQTRPVPIKVTQPNGPDCEPTCHQGAASFTL